MASDEHEEIMRHFDVVAEGLRSDIRLVAEGVALNGERLDRLEASQEAHRAETARNSVEIQALRSEMTREFKAVRTEMARGFADVRAEADASRAETGQSFAGIRAELASAHSGFDRRLRAVEGH